MPRPRRVAQPPVPKQGVIQYGPHPGQLPFHLSKARIRVLACGRRWGKDRASVAETILLLVNLRDDRIRRLAPGRPSLLVPLVHCWVVAPTYNLLKTHWRELLAFVPPDLISRADHSDHVLELLAPGPNQPGDIVIEFKSADAPDKLVGVGLDLLLITEAGIVPDRAWYESLEPTLASPGRLGRAIVNGTPKGKRGFFYQLCMLGRDPSYHHEVQSWEHTSYENPYVPKGRIDAIRRRTPDLIFRQEYLVEWLDDGAGVFRNVRDAAGLHDPQDRIGEDAFGHKMLGPLKDHLYTVGVDWARTFDSSVFTVYDVTDKRVAWVERLTEVSYPSQQAALKALCARYRPQAVLAEANAMGLPIIEQLRLDGLPVHAFATTNASKQEIIDALALAFERFEIAIPNYGPLINELLAYTAERLPSGLIRYTAPDGTHDDTVISLALALHAASVTTLPYGWLRHDPAFVASVARQVLPSRVETDEERRERRVAARAASMPFWYRAEEPVDSTAVPVGAAEEGAT